MSQVLPPVVDKDHLRIFHERCERFVPVIDIFPGGRNGVTFQAHCAGCDITFKKSVSKYEIRQEV